MIGDLMSIRDIEIAAVAHAVQSFNAASWSILQLGDVGPNMTTYRPGRDVASITIENRYQSDGSAYVILKAPPAADTPATLGFEVEPGGVLTLDQLSGIDVIADRGTADGSIKVLVRSYKTASEAPW